MNSVAQEVKYKAKLKSKSLVAKDTYEYRFIVDKRFKYEAGQYVWLQLPNLKYPDRAGDRRAMSIVSAPDNSNEITLLMRAGVSGYKRTVAELSNGDSVIIHGPFGSSFTPPKEQTRPLILLAGGVGVAPFMSLITAKLNKKNSDLKVQLICVNDSEDATPYENLLKKYQKGTDFSTVMLTSKVKKSDLVSIENYQNATVYVAGSQSFVNDTASLLSSVGVPGGQVHYENYYPENERSKLMSHLLEACKERHSSKDKQKSDLHNLNEGDVFLAALESSTNHIIITDTNGIILFANDAACKTTGYTFDEMCGSTPRLWGGLMGKEFYEKLWASKKLGHTIDEKITNRRKDGSIYQVIAHICPIRSHAGEVIGFIGTEEDISDILAAEEVAKVSHDRLQQVTDNIQEVFRLTNLKGQDSTIEYANHALQTIFGITEEELYKNPDIWVQCIHPKDRNKFIKAHEVAEKTGKPLNIRYRVINRKNGETRWVENKTKLIRDSEGRPWRMVGVTRDVTKEREVDKEKTEFVSLAAHQLRTPLTAINWYIELLESESAGKLEPRQAAYLKEVRVGSNRMVKLVNSLLNISRIETGKLSIETKPMDLTALVSAIVHELEPLASEHSCRLKLSLPKGKVSQVDIDENLVRQIINNLISNAIRYSPAASCDVEVSLSRDDNSFIIAVSDMGIGIKPVDQAKIFDKFFRADNARNIESEGTGMGLYLSKIIAEQTATKIWFKSPVQHRTVQGARQGYGSTFYFSIPLTGMVPHEGEQYLEIEG